MTSGAPSNFVRHAVAGGSSEVRCRDDLKRFLRGELEAFPDAHETLEDVIAEGDKVALGIASGGPSSARWVPTRPRGRLLTADYLAVYRLVDGVVVEAWAEWDDLAGLEQLGHLPSPGEGADGT